MSMIHGDCDVTRTHVYTEKRSECNERADLLRLYSCDDCRMKIAENRIDYRLTSTQLAVSHVRNDETTTNISLEIALLVTLYTVDSELSRELLRVRASSFLVPFIPTTDWH